jgi:RecB family exonuclease
MKSYLEQRGIFSDDLIITVNDRLARSLNSPKAIALEGFLSQLWSEVSLIIPLPRVCSESEVLFLWEKVIRQSSPEIFQVKETAKRAIQAFEWSLEYELSFSEGSPEVCAYKKWESQFLSDRLAQSEAICLRSERLQLLIPLLKEASIFNQFSYLFSDKIWLFGFESFTPLQNRFFKVLADHEKVIVFENLSSEVFHAPTVYGCLTVEDEIRQALTYAKEAIKKDSSVTAAIVVPNLPDYYLFIERIASHYLDDLPYVISAGLPLNQTVWMKSAEERLKAQIIYFPDAILVDHLARFVDLLRSSEWLGDTSLSSISYQMVQGIFNRIEALARASRSMGVVSAEEALEILMHALEVPFQAEDDPRAQLFILGMFEAAPLRFDVLWLCGVSNESFPTKPDPNPFIPYDLQRSLNLPRSSADREEALARRLIHRMGVNCPRFIVSYPRFNDGVRQEVSQLFAEIARETVILPSKPLEVIKGYEPELLEFYQDTRAFPVGSEELKVLRGGASILANQAACPFKAFARARLKIEPKEPEDPYLSAKERGILIHEVLLKFWHKVRTSVALKTMDPALLDSTLETIFDEAWKVLFPSSKLFSSAQHALEREYVVKVVSDWLVFEKNRQDFQVNLLEKEVSTSLAGLPLKLRIDRVDLILKENIRLLLDYKTGRSRLEEWMGDRIESPQLPLYATLMPVDGIAFADLSGREPRLSGIVREGVSSECAENLGLKTVNQLKDSEVENFDEVINQWRIRLEHLARNFMNGDSKVDPLETACRYCRLESLCRVSSS